MKNKTNVTMIIMLLIVSLLNPIFAIIIVPFMIIIFLALKLPIFVMKNSSSVIKCSKCGAVLNATDKFCSECGTEYISEEIEFDTLYDKSDKIILKTFIENELREDKNFSTKELNVKRNIALAFFGLFTFIITIMFFFNYPFIICIFLELINLFIFYLVLKYFNIVNFAIKKCKKYPDEDISKVVSDLKNEKIISMNFPLKTLICFLCLVIIPSIFFFNSKLLYVPYDDGYAVFRYTRGIVTEKSVAIPNKYKGKTVLAIAEQAFKNSSVEAVNLPNTLETIKKEAFMNCKNIKKIEIPDTVQEIRGSAFENCSSLQRVTLHEGLKEIRGAAFKNNTQLAYIELPNSLEYLGGSAFSHCSSIVDITIPQNVIEINGQTFEYCTSLRSINLHDNIISIHGEVFVGDRNLETIVLPSKITEIRGNTFQDCTSLKSITIPDGVTRIGGHAFHGCINLSNVDLPSTINEIGSSAFRGCLSLYRIRIPYNAYVNERAFKESPTSIERY